MMIQSSNISLIQNLVKSLFNLKKDSKNYDLNKVSELKITEHLSFSHEKLMRFCDIIEWKSKDIPPTFPYALLTHLHFSLVNLKDFPFSPFGLIHKSETINILKPLKIGAWIMSCYVASIDEVETGYDLTIISELTINGELAWKSTTIASKKVRSKKEVKTFKPTPITSNISWNIPLHQGLKYGLVSQNIDPIHISKVTAKVMGHKSAIIHGMWTTARGLSEYAKNNDFNEIAVKFIKPVYLPAIVIYQENDDGFGIYSHEGKVTHLLVKAKRN